MYHLLLYLNISAKNSLWVCISSPFFQMLNTVVDISLHWIELLHVFLAFGSTSSAWSVCFMNWNVSSICCTFILSYLIFVCMSVWFIKLTLLCLSNMSINDRQTDIKDIILHFCYIHWFCCRIFYYHMFEDKRTFRKVTVTCWHEL